MIILLSNKWDISVDFVVAELRRRNHHFIRLNTEDLIHETASIIHPEGQILLSHRGQTFDLSRERTVIWYRRPGHPFDDIPKAERPPPPTQRFINDQWCSWLEALQDLPNITWVNPPAANNRMENKLLQLRLAAAAGFLTPDTLATNDTHAIQQFFHKHSGRIVAKALYSPLIEEQEKDYFVFTTKVSNASFSDSKSFSYCPAIFQNDLSPKTDYRVTVVGETVMPVRIQITPPNDEVDWRRIKDTVRFAECTLPDDLQSLCCHYVRAAGLHFGAIDLVESHGRFYFLEINPNGEWGWLEKPNGIPVASAICDLLVSLKG